MSKTTRMRKLLTMFTAVLTAICCYLPASGKKSHSERSYDVVIVGGTPSGIMAAIAAAREGCSCIILERSEYVGGLPVNGLGATDIATRGSTTGLFTEFTRLNLQYYKDRFGEDSPQVRDCSDGYHFEPHVAQMTFDKLLGESYAGKITVLTMRQFDPSTGNVQMHGNRISAIRVLNRTNGKTEKWRGKVFIDATYEGDLGAAAGIPFRLGREGRDEFGEPCAGKIYRWWKHGPDEDGTTYEGDDEIQAYNYRLCLTNNTDNLVPIARPENYDRNEYLSLVEDVLTGRNTDVRFKSVTIEQMQENRKRILAGGKTAIPGDTWGMSKVTNMVTLPNMKKDGNNQHLALISTDLPEENKPWPTADWEWRDNFAQRLKDYTLGLLWFAQHDEALPENFRKACLRYGLAADEYADNGNFPRQVYVREGRRLEGTYFFTAKDVLPVKKDARPPIHSESVTSSHYALDSHAVHKREDGRVHLDGFFSYPTAVYTVPYGVMVPTTVENLLFPVAVSGSHVGFSTLRMEPCWMALGEAAGYAASVAVHKNFKVREIPVAEIQNKILNNGGTLVYFKDMTPEDKDFRQVQKLALKGYFPDWKASLDKKIDENTAKLWSELSGRDIKCDNGTKRQWLRALEGNDINDTTPDWALPEFRRPDNSGPVIAPDSTLTFICPCSGKKIRWAERDTFNPAAIVKDGKIVVLFRAEDNYGEGIGKRTSRIGYATSKDGMHFNVEEKPIMYPDNDDQHSLEWPGGCEDPRIVETEDGLYVMTYTQWNRKTARLAVATSTDLRHWTKHGPAFNKAYNGRFRDMFCKSGSIVTKIMNGKQVVAKVGGKYLMYWGERFVNIAMSEDLLNWTPLLDENGNIMKIATPRPGHFDSDMTECGPPAIITDNGILLIYNGRNRSGKDRDRRYAANSYCAGQMLFDTKDPSRLIGRMDEPFLIPEKEFEKCGQYPDGTVFAEGLVLYKGRWHLYYGCADSLVGTASAVPLN